jgi:hypothetical protein
MRKLKRYAAGGLISTGHWRLPAVIFSGGLLLLLTNIAAAQLIDAAEYFFDTDPGEGSGTALSLTPGEEPEVNTSISLAGLDTGLHRLYLRYRDERGFWSSPDCRLFQIRTMEIPQIEAEIVAAECFVDSDPGQGAATTLTVNSAMEVTLNDSFDLDGYDPGWYRIYLRYQDERGFWSSADCRLFELRTEDIPPTSAEIVAAEYFFNNDPGSGNGSALSVTTGVEVTVADNLEYTGLEPGLQLLYLRYQDNLTRWSLAAGRLFYINEVHLPPESPQIVAAEYFFDIDPGQGNGTPVSVTPGAEVTLATSVDAGDLDYGLHRFYLRMQDELGRWSSADCRLFYRNEIIETTVEQNLAAAEYFINVDPGIGNGVPIEFPDDGVWDGTVETVTDQIPDIPVGRHQLGMRFRDSWGAWSSVGTASFVVGPYLHIAPGFPAVLTWEGDMVDDEINIYRALELNSSFNLIASTLGSSYTDAEVIEDNWQRFYYIRQELGESRSTYHLP